MVGVKLEEVTVKSDKALHSMHHTIPLSFGTNPLHTCIASNCVFSWFINTVSSCAKISDFVLIFVYGASKVVPGFSSSVAGGLLCGFSCCWCWGCVVVRELSVGCDGSMTGQQSQSHKKDKEKKKTRKE